LTYKHLTVFKFLLWLLDIITLLVHMQSFFQETLSVGFFLQIWPFTKQLKMQPKCGFTSILTAFNTVTTNLQEIKNKAEKDE